MRTRRPLGLWSGVRSPRFRRDPFVRDVALDPGRATTPRVTAPHMLPSTDNNGSAPAIFSISWLNPTPHTIAVYASPLPSPAAAQHSLAGGRYPFPAPDFHRLDRASFAWRTLSSCYSPCYFALSAHEELLRSDWKQRFFRGAAGRNRAASFRFSLFWAKMGAGRRPGGHAATA